MRKKVKLIECIRNTWQGEGISSGLRFTLLRGKFCNKKCAFCDTLVKMRVSQESEYSIEDVQKILYEERTNLMITGGEPTYNKHFDDTVLLLSYLDYKLANVETNGYRLFDLMKSIDVSKNVKFIYSPKIFSMKDLEDELNKTEGVIDDERVYIKVVYEDNKLINEYLQFLDDRILGIKNEYEKVWVMPEGDTMEKLIKNAGPVFDVCERYKFNFSSRNHIIYNFI